MFRSLLVLFLVVGVFFILPFNTFEEIKLQEDEITIFVKGEVKEEIFMEVSPHTTIKELINRLALTSEADIGALDLNRYLENQEVLTIPKKKENVCISINSANEETLTTLNGIGPSTAQKITAYRTLNGPFIYLEDLLNVSGIGPSKFEKIKDHICL